MPWLKDSSGAIYRIEAITAVVPQEMRDDKRDQAKVTRVTALITTAGGHTHTTSLEFDKVVALVDPPVEVPADPAGPKS